MRHACHKKWGFTDNELCDCGDIQTVSHIVNFCPLTTFDGGLLRLHEADEAAVDWLTTYGSQHTLIIISIIQHLRRYRQQSECFLLTSTPSYSLELEVGKI